MKALDIAERYVALQKAPWSSTVQKDDLKEVRAALSLPDPEGAEAVVWRPIETAPRDSSAFLAYRRGQVANASCLVRDDGEMWSFGNQSGHRDVFPEIVPTHWMPLPPSPYAARSAAYQGKEA